MVLEVHPKPVFNSLISNLANLNTWQDATATTKRPHIPHITLVNQVPTSDLAAITKSFDASNNLKIHFECTSISLFAKDSRWPSWQELAQASLAKK
jgi:2'-5' RNA ligase